MDCGGTYSSETEVFDARGVFDGYESSRINFLDPSKLILRYIPIFMFCLVLINRIFNHCIIISIKL